MTSRTPTTLTLLQPQSCSKPDMALPGASADAGASNLPASTDLPTSPPVRPLIPKEVPRTFPRNSWHNIESFGMPPYGPSDGLPHTEICWAAREASRTFCRVVGYEDVVNREPTHYEYQPYPPCPDRIDALCFALAVFDKTFELNWYDQRQRYHVPKSERITWEDWYRGTHKWIKAVYKEACLHLPAGMQPPDPKYVHRVCRIGLDLWLFHFRLATYPPERRLPVALPVPLGRFSARYYEHKVWVLEDDGITTKTYWEIIAATPLPADLANPPTLAVHNHDSVAMSQTLPSGSTLRVPSALDQTTSSPMANQGVRKQPSMRSLTNFPAELPLDKPEPIKKSSRVKHGLKSLFSSSKTSSSKNRL